MEISAVPNSMENVLSSGPDRDSPPDRDRLVPAADKGILRSPKIGEQLQQRRNLTAWMTALKNQCSENICCYKRLEERLMIEWE